MMADGRQMTVHFSSDGETRLPFSIEVITWETTIFSPKAGETIAILANYR
jgi:hypothetical protein